MDSWLIFRRNRVILNQWTKWNNLSFERFSKASFIGRLPIRQEICDVSQTGVTFHGICPPIFIQTWLQQYSRGNFFLLCALLFQQSHLFLICVVQTCNDSRWDLHKICRIPRNCQCKWLYVSSPIPRAFASSFVFPEKFLFCTDTLGSTEWLSPAPRLHIGDCFEIRNFHWELCDLLLSSHQNFQQEVRLHHCVSCTGAL